MRRHGFRRTRIPRTLRSGRNAQERPSKSRPIGNRASRRPEATSQIEKPSGERRRHSDLPRRRANRPARRSGFQSGQVLCRCRESVLRRRRPRAGGPRYRRSWPGACRRARGPFREARRGADQHDDVAARPAPEVAPDERARNLAAGIERDIAEDLLGPFGLGGVECLGGQSKLRRQRRAARTSGRDPGLPRALTISPVDLGLEPLVDRSQPSIRPQGRRNQRRSASRAVIRPAAATAFQCRLASLITRDTQVGGRARIG